MTETTQQDTIQQSITINAPIERVWSLVSRAGWWAGPADFSRPVLQEGETADCKTAEYSDFPVRVEKLDPMTFVAFRWASAFPGESLTDGNSTLVEFSLRTEAGGTVVEVRESGFASLKGEHAFIADQFRGNVEGWEAQLGELASAAGATA